MRKKSKTQKLLTPMDRYTWHAACESDWTSVTSHVYRIHTLSSVLGLVLNPIYTSFDLINIHDQHTSSNCSHLLRTVVVNKQCTCDGQVTFLGTTRTPCITFPPKITIKGSGYKAETWTTSKYHCSILLNNRLSDLWSLMLQHVGHVTRAPPFSTFIISQTFTSP